MPSLPMLPPLEKTIDRCKVISLGTGSVPKNITVQLPGADGAQVGARWTGEPPLAVNDYCRLLKVNSDTIKYLVVGTSAGTGVVRAKNNFSATADPTINDDSGDGYGVGSVWINTTLDTVFTCADATAGTAVWKRNDALTTPQYVTLATSTDLTNERVLTQGTGITVTDAGAGSTVTVAIDEDDIPYTPASNADWGGSDPGDVDDALDWIGARNRPLRIKNTSGGTANSGDVGYIDYVASAGGEYKTTTTEAYTGAWCAVLVGGANNADVYVTQKGRLSLNYDGSDPAAGDLLITSTTGGKIKTNGANMRPEVCAIAQAAGSGGAVDALLLTQTQYIPLTSANDVFRIASSSDSNFTGTIDSKSGATLVYTVTGGTNEDSIKPFATTNLAKIRLYNSTRGEYLLISATDTGTNTITFTTNVPAGWAALDVVTARSPLNTINVGGGYYYEMEFASEVPFLTRSIEMGMFMSDSGGAGATGAVHPYEAGSSSKQTSVITQSTSGINSMVNTALINKKFTMLWDATGTATLSIIARLRGAYIASP